MDKREPSKSSHKYKEFYKKTNEDFELLFVGDTSFGENYQEKVPREKGGSILKRFGYEYSLEKVKSIMLRADFVVANLETPITDISKSPFEGRKEYLHWTDITKSPETLVKFNVSLVSLANNHSFDYGDDGFDQTLKILNKYEIPVIGAGENINNAGKPFIAEINFGTKIFKFAIISAFEELQNYRSKYQVYATDGKPGLMPIEIDAITDQIRQLKVNDPNIFVIFFPHWGDNYKWCDKDQIRISETLLSNGVDLIIGHGAHMIQEVEKVDDKWIVYSIGNFVFNSPGRYERMNAPPYSFVASLNASLKNDDLHIALKLYPIITNNRITNYQPRFLEKNEFIDFLNMYTPKMITRKIEHYPIEVKKDKIGCFIELPVLKEKITKFTHPINWIGMIYHQPQKNSEENHISPWIARAFVIDRELEKHNAKLICYMPADYNPKNETVTGYMLEHGQFKKISIPLPKVNYNFHIGEPGRDIFREFEKTVLKNGIEIYPIKSVRVLTSDKLQSAEVVAKYDKSIVPYTELYNGSITQLDVFLKKSNLVFIKPRFGNMGNGIFVIRKDNNNISVDYYLKGNKTNEFFDSLPECASYIKKTASNEPYIIQQGINIVRHKGLVFNIRTVGFHFENKWVFLNELITSGENCDVSNLYQGGQFHISEKYLANVFPAEKIPVLMDKIKTISSDIANLLNAKYENKINEIAFDVLIDESGNPYIAELNVKPGLVGEPMRYSNYFLMTDEENENYETLTVKHGEFLAKSLLDKYRYTTPDKIDNNKVYWYQDIKAYPPLQTSNISYLLDLIYNALDKHEYYINSLPDHLGYNSPQIVFITVSNSASKSNTFFGSGCNLLSAVNAALNCFQKLSKSLDLKIVKLDIVHDVHTVNNHNPTNALIHDRSLFGIAFEQPLGLAYLAEEIVANSIINSKNILVLKSISKSYRLSNYQKSILSNAKTVTLFRFKTISYVKSKEITQPLYRGHPLFKDINTDTLLSSAISAGEYLEFAVKKDGDFAYEYLPKIDCESKRYNILRHAGTVYSMLELYELTKNESLLNSAKLALSGLLNRAKPKRLKNEEALCIVENDFVKLGANALALLTLSKYTTVTGDESFRETAKKLALWIEYSQHDSGYFNIHKLNFSNNKKENFISGYYPGEAIFSLLRFYQIDQDLRWLEIAEKAANYIINVRDKHKKISEVEHDHWLLYGLNELHRFNQNNIYIEHTLKISEAILRAQYKKNEPIDYLGSFYIPPRSTPTAVRTEGLCAAYNLLHYNSLDKSDEAKRILEGIKLGIRFQLQTQFQPERALYLNNGKRTLGGFSKSLSDYSIRIDYVQHNLSSLIGLYNILNKKP